MEKMEPSPIQTRLTARRNSTTVDNVTQRFQRVSTDENIDHLQKDVKTTMNKKHRLSSSGIDSVKTSKKLRQGHVSQEQVMKTTRAVIEKLLQKETMLTPKHRQSRKSKRKRRSNISPIACTFSEAGENSDILLNNKESKTEDVFLINDGESLKLDFSGDIEADSCFLPSDIEADGCEQDHSTKVESGSTQESAKEQVDKKTISDVAKALQDIGDKLNNEVKREIRRAAIEIVKKKSYKTYKDALQSLLDISYQQPADQLCDSERYQVALVWLVTEKTISEAKMAMASTSEVNGIVENAVHFISEKFPCWLNPWM